MPALRKALEDDGLSDAQTYVQSGNVVLRSEDAPDALARRVGGLISAEFGLEIAVVVRTRDELAEVVERNPLADVAVNPKRYQVTFLSEPLDSDVIDRLATLALESERLIASGRELYSWHPEGMGRSKLWGRVAGPGLGVTATGRNWTTVTTLLEMADAAGGDRTR